MKKSYLPILIAVLVIVGIMIWYFLANINYKPTAQFYIMLVLVGFAVFLGVKRLISEKKGEPAEDEMTKMVRMKASSISYYISLYYILILIYLSDEKHLDAHTALSAAILGMALIFALSWVYIKLKGIRDE